MNAIAFLKGDLRKVACLCEKFATAMFAQARVAGPDVHVVGAQLEQEENTLVANYKVDGIPFVPAPSFSAATLAKSALRTPTPLNT